MFLSPPKCTERLGTNIDSYLMGSRAVYQAIRRPRREANHSSPSADVKS
jgi:hypothetical protein